MSHSVSIIESKHKGPFIFYRVGVGHWLDMITNLILRFEGRLYLQPNSRRGWFVLFGAQYSREVREPKECYFKHSCRIRLHFFEGLKFAIA